MAADAAELFCAFKQEHRHQAANKWDTYRQHLLLRCEPWPTATCVGVATWHGVYHHSWDIVHAHTILEIEPWPSTSPSLYWDERRRLYL